MKTAIVIFVTVAVVYAMQSFKKRKVKTSLLDPGKWLFPNDATAWEAFYNSFVDNKKMFLSQNSSLLENYDNFDLNNLQPLEVLYIFGDAKGLIAMTDWRGEENEREVEESLNKIIK